VRDNDTRKRRQEDNSTLEVPQMATRYWLAAGTAENWQIAFEHGNTWGLRCTKRAGSVWNRISEGDLFLFYVTRPSSGVVGFGPIRTKFRQDRPLWPDELGRNRVIWPLRLEFDVDFCLPPGAWKGRAVRDVKFRMLARGGIGELDNKTAVRAIEQLDPPKVPSRLAEPRGSPAMNEPAEAKGRSAPILTHDEIKARLREMGSIQGLIAEDEYKMDGTLLDVVWRRVEKSVPTYVFEVHVGGDLYHALAKLKHAYDLWNSHLFLVASEGHKGQIDRLLQGTFHEIRTRVRVIDVGRLEQLYHHKSSYKRLEKELGIG